MDRFHAADFRELLEDRSWPCTSVYLPTHISAPDHHQNPVRLKNLLRQAETQLAEIGPEAAELLSPAWHLLESETFWRGRSEGLAIFASPRLFRAYRVPLLVPEQAEVGDRFVLRPLLPLLTPSVRCLILQLSRNVVRLYEATPFEIEEITPEAMPRDLKTALNTDQVDRGSQTHSAMSVPLGKQAAVFHGQGGQADTIKQETLRFFQLVDGALRGLPGKRSLPLILAGVDADVALFRSITSHPHLAEEHLHGNMDRLSERQIFKRALPIITAICSELQSAAISRLREANGKSARALDAILPAAHAGRVDTLFVRRHVSSWGKFRPDTGQVETHPTKEPGDEDLLEVAVVETATHGGTVFVLPAEELSDSPIAAIYRY